MLNWQETVIFDATCCFFKIYFQMGHALL